MLFVQVLKTNKVALTPVFSICVNSSMKKKPHWPQMFSRSIVPTPKSALSSLHALKLSNIYLENATRTADNKNDHDIALMLCHNAEVALSQVRSANKKAGYPTVLGDMIAAYNNLSNLLQRLGYEAEARKLRNKTERWR